MELHDSRIVRRLGKQKSNENTRKIVNWLWEKCVLCMVSYNIF